MKFLAVLLVVLAAALALPIDDELNSRIVGGVPATIEQFPWTVSIRVFGQHSCGGSIIRPNRILTAAHCTQRAAGDFTVRAGSTANASGGQTSAVARVINHPNYFPVPIPFNDISILWLTTALNTAPAGVALIPLPPAGAAVATGALATVAGWGVLSEGSQAVSPGLRSVQVPVVSNAECQNLKGVPITGGMLCAGFLAGGRDACQGDSGGPLTLNGQLIGVVSFGIGCARPNNPGVYARTAFYRAWIESNL